MKKELLMYFIIKIFFVTGCLSDNQSKNNLPCIDVTKNYPVKEIILTDIATVNYVHLNTDNDDYLYKGFINYVTENTIVVADDASGSILFFSRSGEPKARFNRHGAGPEEYLSNMIDVFFYDEPADDVYVGSNGKSNIQVYSSTGKYKRTLTLPQGIRVNEIVEFDDQSLIVFDQQLMWKKLLSGSNFIPQKMDSSYLRISKTDGEIVEYIEFPGNEIDLSIRGKMTNSMTALKRLTKCTAGVVLCNHESDTVFLYDKDSSLTPLFCKTPLISDLDKKIILNNYIEIGSRQYFTIQTLLSFEESSEKVLNNAHKFYMRDKQTGEIYLQKITLPDYKGYDYAISSLKNKTYDEKETLVCSELDLFELKKAYKEKRLSGKLKELVATLDEMRDNNVLMLVHFK